MSEKERQGKVRTASIKPQCFEAYVQVHVLKCAYVCFDARKTQGKEMCVDMCLILHAFLAYLKTFPNDVCVRMSASKCVCFSSRR